MNIKFLSSFFLSPLFAVTAVFGQENFQPGYIISEEQDTIRGFIDYRNWSRNPEQITFKSTPVSEAIVHHVDEIWGFFVKDETYVKATVPHDINPVRTEDLSYSPVPKYEKLTAFLAVLYHGPKSLYLLKDKENKINLYIKNEAGEYVILVNYRYLVQTGNVITNPMYKAQLGAYFSDCSAVVKRIKTLTYSEISLAKLFKQYYSDCSTQAASAVSVPEKLGFEYGVTAGATLTTLKFSGHANLENLNFDPSLRPAAGAYLNITVPRGNRRLSIFNELSISGYSAKSSRLTPPIGGVQTRFDEEFGATYIKLTNMLRYLFPAGNVKFFINGGISNGMSVTQANKQRTEEITSSSSITHQNKLLSDTRKYEQGLVVGAGAIFGKFSLELRGEASNGMSVYGNLNSSVRRYSFLMGYRFR